MKTLVQYRKRLDELASAKRLWQQHRVAKQEETNKATKALSAAKEAQQIAQTVAQAIQQQVHTRIAETVTKCLEAVFDDPYGFAIRFDAKRGKTEATPVFTRGTTELEDPLNEVGGGVVDVAALGLRLAAILLHRPPLRRLLVLDEPFRFVRGKTYRDRTRALLEMLATELGFQFVINTDVSAFRMGTVVETEK